MELITSVIQRKLIRLLLDTEDNTEDNTEDEAFKKIIKCPPNVKPDESLPRFGPFYGNDQLAVSGTKKKAWQHIKYNRSSSDRDVGSAKEIFAAAIRRVEKEAKETYGEKITGYTSSEFRLMMVKDGCFFLQLAFLILGKSSDLGYSKNDPIFGTKLKNKDIRKWIESMFYVGNQIPLVVLNELMKQKFFQDVIAKGKWDDHPPTSSLCKKVFYELLVSPQQEIQKQLPCYHLLHSLHKLVVGPARPAFMKKQLQEEDIFDVDDEINDLEASNININIEDGGQERSFDIDNNNKGIFPSATELRQADIVIKKLKSNRGGIRSIDFQSYYFQAYLYLPVLPVDDYMEILFRNLKTYEISQKKSQVTSYLRLMSDIIQTPQDVRLLKKQGIIEGSDDDAEKLPSILKRLSSEDQVTLAHEFHILKRKIRDYSSPFVHYRDILNVVVFLTLVQSFFAVLAYFKPPKQH